MAKRKQKIWLVNLITIAKSVEIIIYGQKKDAIKEFKRRIYAAMASEISPKVIEYEVKCGLENRAFQYVVEGQTYVITLVEDVVN